jgi:hypothetical protein
MRRIKEVLRLKYELGLGQRQIARSCSIGQATVNDYLRRAEAAGLRWPLTEEWDDDRIERDLFGNDTSRQRRHCSEHRRISHRFTTSSGNTGS